MKYIIIPLFKLVIAMFLLALIAISFTLNFIWRLKVSTFAIGLCSNFRHHVNELYEILLSFPSNSHFG